MYRIAIDGPSGAGKSSLAKALAKRLQLVYVDTGALYRAIGLFVYNSGVNPSDTVEVENLLPKIKLELTYVNGEQKVMLCGEDVGDKIRTNEISMIASKVSAIPAVRAFLMDLQKNMAAKNNVIMDGRDIGTVIMPDADTKIYLTASCESRAQRRFTELCEKGHSVNKEEILKDIIQRDNNDSQREIAPSVAADDAVLLDNSCMTFEETVDEAIKIIQTRN